MRRIFPMLAVSASLGSALTEPPLPTWNPDEKKTMFADGWLAGDSLLTFDLEDAEEETPLQVEKPTAEELATPPEDEGEVSEKYLAAYFAERPKGHLIDPQELLSTRERKDLEAFLDYHAGDSSIDMYVYVFGANQEIPGDVREEEVVERLYSVGKPALVVYYHLGAPQRSTVYLSPVITDTVSAAEQRRALESSVMQAFGSTKPFDQAEAFLVQMSIRIYWMERMAAGTAEKTMEKIPEGESARAFHNKDGPAENPTKIPSWVRLAGWAFATACGGALALCSFLMWWRGRAKFRFPEFEVEPRLGGNHAAGIGAVISFSNPEFPPAMQRNQVPDYMRRA